jgi:spermidine/putrescine transport system substrate-binding protein
MLKSLVLLVVVALLLSALPTFGQEAAEVEPWVCPPGYEGQTLSVYNWSTYIAEDTIPNFEAACGVTVLYDVYETGEAMLGVIRAGNPGYDIVVPAGNTVGIMIEEELLIPLDYALIPNLANLSPDLTSPSYDPGNVYSIAYQWGTVAVGVNLNNAPDIRTWEDVWTYDGNVAWLDDLRVMIGIALMNLGYDPNSENPDEIAEARDYLVANGANVVAIAADDGQVLLERGEADIVVEYSGDIFQVITSCECEDYAYIIPEDGANIWTDNMAIPVGAPNPELAMVFMDYVMHPQVGADISNYTTYGTPNQASLDLGLIDESALNNPGIYPPSEVRENLFYALTVAPEAEQFYNDAWDEIKVLLGR